MKKSFYILVIVGLAILCGYYIGQKYYAPVRRADNPIPPIEPIAAEGEIMEGDLIFHTSMSGQSKAIQLATRSKYSHCGVIYKKENEWYVFEAVQPVGWTPLNKWIARGEDGNM